MADNAQPAQSEDFVKNPKWIVTSEFDTRSDMLMTNRPVADLDGLIVQVLEAARGGATMIRVRPNPMPKLAYEVEAEGREGRGSPKGA